MLFHSWPLAFLARLGGRLPDSYAAFDLETTGFSREHDVIVEFGHVLVQNGQVMDRLGILLDWTNHPVVPDGWLRQRLNQVAVSMASSGRTYRVTYQRMQEEGVKPDKAFGYMYELLSGLVRRGRHIVAHNGYGFDEPMLAANFAGFGIASDFGFADRLIDTMSIENGVQLHPDPKSVPKVDETVREYFTRLGHQRCKSALDRVCIPKYKLDSKVGADYSKTHTAEYDAYLVHLLYSEYRAMAAVPQTAVEVRPSLLPPREAPSPEPLKAALTNAAARAEGLAVYGDPHRRRGQRNR